MNEGLVTPTNSKTKKQIRDSEESKVSCGSKDSKESKSSAVLSSKYSK